MSSASDSPSSPSSPTTSGAAPSSLAQSAPLAPAVDSTANEGLDAGVLIVDDDASFRLGLQTFLKEFVGVKSVYSAANGLEALECLRENSDIEIVTLDQDMPEMDGLTFLKVVKDGDFPTLAAIMITGDPDAGVEEQFRSLNSDGLVTEQFLEKPVDFNDLEAVLLSSHQTLKRQGKDAAAKSTAAAVAAFAAGTGVAGALAKKKAGSEAATESTTGQKQKQDDNTMNQTEQKTQAGGGVSAATKKVPTTQNPVLGAAPDAKTKAGSDSRGGADWIGAGPPQSAASQGDVSEAGGARIGELRARVDWLADSLNGRLDKIETQIANVGARTPSMAKRFWLGLLKWCTLGLLAWAFIRFDAGEQIVKYYGIAKAKVAEMTSAGESRDLTLEAEGGDVKADQPDVIPDSRGEDASASKETPGPASQDREMGRPEANAKSQPVENSSAAAGASTAPAPEPTRARAKSANDADQSKNPAPAPAPEPKGGAKSRPSHPAEPESESESSASDAPGKAASKPKASEDGKGDSEKAKARQRRQRKDEAVQQPSAKDPAEKKTPATEASAPQEKSDKQVDPESDPASRSEAADDAATDS